MATNNLFNVPSWTSIQELFYRRLGIKLDPTLVTYSYAPGNVVQVEDVPLGEGDGEQSVFIMQYNGTTIQSVSNLIVTRTDWDGTWTLSLAPHANGVLYSDQLDNLNVWQQVVSSVALSEVLYANTLPYYLIQSDGGNWETGLLQDAIGTLAVNGTGTLVIALRAADVNNTIATISLTTTTTGSGFFSVNDNGSQILSGPGQISISGESGAFPGGNGTAYTVSGLSTTEDTLLEVSVINNNSAAMVVNVGVWAGALTNFNTNSSILATRVSFNLGGPMAYISNQGTVITQPDFTINGAAIDLTEPLAEGGTLTWGGTAQLPAMVTVTANPTQTDGAQAPYSGSIAYPLTQLQVNQELPPLLVWSDLFPMTVQALADYLMSNYGYYLEDGEFSVVGDPHATPLARANTGTIYDGLNVQTQQFSLQATANAIRWHAGSQVVFKVASSNSIVPSDGFSITSGAPPAGTLGSAYDYTYTVTGGTAPFSFVVIQGTAPGIVNPTTGEMTNASLDTLGTFSWIIQVTDNVGRIVTRQDQVTVSEAPLTMAPGTLNPSVSVGVPVNLPFNVSGGLPPYTYSIYLGTLPPFVSIEDGAFVGTFEGSTSQTSTSVLVGVQVTDSQSNTLQRIFTFSIADRDEADIQASLCTKVLHWFECGPLYPGGGVAAGNLIYDCTNRANMEVMAIAGSTDAQVLLESGPGSQAMFGFNGTAYTQNNTTAYNLTGDFAIMALVNFASVALTNPGQALISRGGDATGGYELQVGTGGDVLGLDVNMSGTVESVDFPSPISAGSGNFYFTITQLYQGIPEQEFNAGASSLLAQLPGSPMANNTDALFLGIHPSLAPSSIFRGELGMIGIFTEKLWSDERKWLYNGGQYQNFRNLGFWDTLTVTPSSSNQSSQVVGEEVHLTWTVAGGTGVYVDLNTLSNDLPAGLSLSFDGVNTITLSGKPQAPASYVDFMFISSTDAQQATVEIVLNIAYAGVTLVNLPMTGSNGATSVTDTTGKVWTLHGNAQVSTSVDAQGALFFDGTNSYASTPLTTAFDFAGVPYTVSLDVYPQLATAFMLSSTNASEMPLLMGLDGDSGNPGSVTGLFPYVGWFSTGTWNAARGAMAANQNAWNTVEGYYDSVANKIAVFLNGQVVGFATPSEEQVAPPSGGAIMLGCDWNNANFFQGYMRNLLVSTGLIYKTLTVGSMTYAQPIVNQPFTGSVPILGGSGTYSNLVITSGNVPPGQTVSLGFNDIVLSGAVSATGTYTFHVSFQSSDGQTGNASLTVTVIAAFPTLTLTGNFAGGTAETAYSSELVIAGGDGIYIDPTLQSGNLPDGTALSISGSNLVLSGTPTTAGTYSFVVSVTSEDGQTALSTVQSVTIASA